MRTLLKALLLATFPWVASTVTAWEPRGVLNVPAHNYSFLAATPSGDLLAATFNSQAPGQPPRQLPALLIRDAGGNPQVVQLALNTFDPQRGYSGVASDAAGSFYLSADTGNAATCFIRKYKPDASPDPAFGSAGELRVGRRTLGIDVLGEYLLVAVDWGEIMVLDIKTGRYIGNVPKVGNEFVRDIAIDPRTLSIFGVAKGGVIKWRNGTPWEPGKYLSEQLMSPAGEVRSGEGIYIDPVGGLALLTPVPGNTLLQVPMNGGQPLRTVIPAADSKTHLADSVLSFDGTRLYVSDMNGQKIHVLVREQPVQQMTVAAPTVGSNQPTPPPPPPTTGPVPAPTWHRSYTDAIEIARRENKPMAVYFRRRGFERCESFEKGVLLTDAFNRRAQGYVCVFEDVADNQLLAYRFGVLRVPHLAILDRAGQTRASFTWDINTDQLFQAMESVR